MTLEVKSLGHQRVRYLLHSSREVADPCYDISSIKYSLLRCIRMSWPASGHPHRRISFESGGREAWNKYWTGQASQGSMTEKNNFLIGYQTWSIVYLLTAFSVTVHFLFT